MFYSAYGRMKQKEAQEQATIIIIYYKLSHYFFPIIRSTDSSN